MSRPDFKSPLKLGIPKGSLESSTLELFERVGLKFGGSSRTLWLDSSDTQIEPILLKPQEIPLYVKDGRLDAGLSGRDWLVEQDVLAHISQLVELPYSRQTTNPLRWVLAVPDGSAIRSIPDLREACESKRRSGSAFVIATELTNTSRMWLARNGVDAVVERSWGATEAKGDYFADAIIEGTETGSSLRANNLREVAEIISSRNVFFANRQIMESTGAWKREKIVGIAHLIEAALRAVTHVELHIVLPQGHVGGIPVLPTEAPIVRTSTNGMDVIQVVISQNEVPRILPEVIKAGACDAWISPISIYYKEARNAR